MSEDFLNFFDILLQEIENEDSRKIVSEICELYTQALHLLGSFTFAHDWAHDCGLDYDSREYKVADATISDITKKAGALYSKMFDYKYTGEIN